jgi:hypothetical protein
MSFDQQKHLLSNKKAFRFGRLFRLLFINTLILTYLKREFPSERKAA